MTSISKAPQPFPIVLIDLPVTSQPFPASQVNENTWVAPGGAGYLTWVPRQVATQPEPTTNPTDPSMTVFRTTESGLVRVPPAATAQPTRSQRSVRSQRPSNPTVYTVAQPPTGTQSFGRSARSRLASVSGAFAGAMSVAASVRSTRGHAVCNPVTVARPRLISVAPAHTQGIQPVNAAAASKPNIPYQPAPWFGNEAFARAIAEGVKDILIVKLNASVTEEIGSLVACTLYRTQRHHYYAYGMLIILLRHRAYSKKLPTENLLVVVLVALAISQKSLVADISASLNSYNSTEWIKLSMGQVTSAQDFTRIEKKFIEDLSWDVAIHQGQVDEMRAAVKSNMVRDLRYQRRETFAEGLKKHNQDYVRKYSARSRARVFAA